MHFVSELEFGSVQTAVFTDSRQENQIAQGVICAVPVAMMDYLASDQQPPESLLGDEMMLVNVAAPVNSLTFIVIWRKCPDITIGINKTATLPSSGFITFVLADAGNAYLLAMPLGPEEICCSVCPEHDLVAALAHFLTENQPELAAANALGRS